MHYNDVIIEVCNNVSNCDLDWYLYELNCDIPEKHKWNPVLYLYIPHSRFLSDIALNTSNV